MVVETNTAYILNRQPNNQIYVKIIILNVHKYLRHSMQY